MNSREAPTSATDNSWPTIEALAAHNLWLMIGQEHQVSSWSMTDRQQVANLVSTKEALAQNNLRLTMHIRLRALNSW